MARIAGVNIPTNKRVIIALTYIHGIGRTTAVEIANKLGIDHARRVQDLNDEEVLRLRETIDADYTGGWHCPGPYDPARLLLRCANPGILPTEGMVGPWAG